MTAFMSISRRRIRSVVLLLGAVWMGGCDSGETTDPRRTDTTKVEPAKSAQVLSFPDAVQVDDASVNAFVRQAMGACARGDYDEFRLLWSARQEPLQQDEFDAGWKAVLEINIRSLDLIRLGVKTDGGDEELRGHYVFLAEVKFDPQHPAGRKQPTRQVVLLVGKEQDQWRLARAPAKVRSWARDRLASAETSEGPSAPRSTTPVTESSPPRP